MPATVSSRVYSLDIATLTGAIVTSLGHFVSGLFTYSKDPRSTTSSRSAMQNAGRNTGEWVWRLPVDEDYKVQLASDVADLVNAQTDRSSGAGSITAAVFLRQFIDFDVVQSWAHLDIAGTSLMERTLIYNKCPYWPKEGATGVGVRLMTRLAEELSVDGKRASADPLDARGAGRLLPWRRNRGRARSRWAARFEVCTSH